MAHDAHQNAPPVSMRQGQENHRAQLDAAQIDMVPSSRVLATFALNPDQDFRRAG
jgi:hypothetical protein